MKTNDAITKEVEIRIDALEGHLKTIPLWKVFTRLRVRASISGYRDHLKFHQRACAATEGHMEDREYDPSGKDDRQFVGLMASPTTFDS